MKAGVKIQIASQTISVGIYRTSNVHPLAGLYAKIDIEWRVPVLNGRRVVYAAFSIDPFPYFPAIDSIDTRRLTRLF